MRLMATLAVVLFLVSPLTAFADEAPSLEALIVEMADSPAEHKAIAAYYERRAAEARNEAEKHEQMAKAYSGGKFTARNRMKDHCTALAKEYRELASEYEAMAAAHADAAG